MKRDVANEMSERAGARMKKDVICEKKVSDVIILGLVLLVAAICICIFTFIHINRDELCGAIIRDLMDEIDVENVGLGFEGRGVESSTLMVMDNASSKMLEETVNINENDYTRSAYMQGSFFNFVPIYAEGDTFAIVGYEIVQNQFCVPYGRIVLPAEYLGRPVIAIAGEGFRNNRFITSVIIPTGVERIGDYAFFGCTELATVDMSNTVDRIGIFVFGNCSKLSRIQMSNRVVFIGDGAFCGCISLATIDLPDNVRSIGRRAFANCISLIEIAVPKSVVNIGANAFAGWGRGQTIICKRSNEPLTGWEDWNGGNATIRWSKCVTFVLDYYGCENRYMEVLSGDRITHIPNPTQADFPFGTWFVMPSGDSIDWNLPANYNYQFVGWYRESEHINRFDFDIPIMNDTILYARWRERSNDFMFSEIRESGGKTVAYSISQGSMTTPVGDVVLPKEHDGLPITAIDTSGFLLNRRIRSVEIPETITVIGKNAFYGCTNIVTIFLPQSVERIDDYAFGCCTGLKSIFIPENIKSIGRDVFGGCTANNAYKHFYAVEG